MTALCPTCGQAHPKCAAHSKQKGGPCGAWPTPGSTVCRHHGTTHEAKPSIWYVLYENERKHLVQVCSAALKAGVEERLVRLAEQQGDLVAMVIRRILDDLDLTAEQQGRVGEVVPRHLRLVAGGAA